MPTGKRLRDFKLLYPTGQGRLSRRASATFTKEWNAMLGL